MAQEPKAISREVKSGALQTKRVWLDDSDIKHTRFFYFEDFFPY